MLYIHLFRSINNVNILDKPEDLMSSLCLYMCIVCMYICMDILVCGAALSVCVS